MRIYQNCKEAINDIARELKKNGVGIWTQTYQNKDIHNNPDFQTKEIEAFSFSIIDTTDKAEMPGVTTRWADAEFKERVSGLPRNPGVAWTLRKKVWKEFQRSDTKFDYTYASRMYWQIKPVLSELKKHPETRQAIVEIHDRSLDQKKMGKQRIPCSMFYQFMFRDKKLDIIYVMRSTDFSLHFSNDIYLAMKLQEYFAKKLDIKTGKFIFFASSLHIYKRNWNLLKNY